MFLVILGVLCALLGLLTLVYYILHEQEDGASCAIKAVAYKTALWPVMAIGALAYPPARWLYHYLYGNGSPMWLPEKLWSDTAAREALYQIARGEPCFMPPTDDAAFRIVGTAQCRFTPHGIAIRDKYDWHPYDSSGDTVVWDAIDINHWLLGTTIARLIIEWVFLHFKTVGSALNGYQPEHGCICVKDVLWHRLRGKEYWTYSQISGTRVTEAIEMEKGDRATCPF